MARNNNNMQLEKVVNNTESSKHMYSHMLSQLWNCN